MCIDRILTELNDKSIEGLPVTYCVSLFILTIICKSINYSVYRLTFPHTRTLTFVEIFDTSHFLDTMH